jgi:hypothetical protein
MLVPPSGSNRVAGGVGWQTDLARSIHVGKRAAFEGG